jgi:hypothetical protein
VYHLPHAICEFSGDLMAKPWDNWIPGVLNKGQMQALVDEGILFVPNDTIGAASLDLTLTAEAYKMKCGSVKPGGDKRFSVVLKDKALAERLPMPPEGFFVLESQHTYVFEVAERLDSAFEEIGIYGQATAKSSVGRVDVLARLIVDGMDQYEKFNAPNMKGQSGHVLGDHAFHISSCGAGGKTTFATPTLLWPTERRRDFQSGDFSDGL